MSMVRRVSSDADGARVSVMSEGMPDGMVGLEQQHDKA